MNPWLQLALVNLLTLIPQLLVQVIGLILALFWWRRHPAVSVAFMAAIALFIGSTILSIAVSAWMPILREEQGWSQAQTATVYSAIGMVRSLIAAIGWGLVLYAVFGGRVPARAGLLDDSGEND